MTATALRKEIHDFVDEMRDEDLSVLRPLCFRLLYGGTSDSESLVVETDLEQDEKDIILRGRKERAENPESYTSLEDCIMERKRQVGC